MRRSSERDGFPESHAASFALLVYASSWIKAYYPDIFCAALLNAQPMGFYAPAQLIRDAREHGVTILPVAVNHSDWDCTLEDASFAKAAIDGRPASMRSEELRFGKECVSTFVSRWSTFYSIKKIS